ncbi:hypothetical protein TSUD_162920 [Trifolium subterraneum]|uniref:RNA-directed DNA polymerase n=1 Tax=Trifolium subterraneum TaxID=3900 RepID=A0A2Z6MRW6_TRISU|nr:hypothetical protein TSUD_162920 [Trifolium subterraneum]
MPTYAKFMKEILTKKRRVTDEETIHLDASCSAIIQRTLPQKEKDPGRVTLPVTIGNVNVGKALIDLGSSINLIPLSVIERIGGLDITRTRMTLQLADKTVTRPSGIAEDVLVKVDKFMFPIDFVVMDIEEDDDVPLILGRPFMKTARMMIDIDDGVMKVRVQDEEVCFNLWEAMKHSNDKDECFKLDATEEAILDARKQVHKPSSLEQALTDAFTVLDPNNEQEIEEWVKALDELEEVSPCEAKLEELKNDLKPVQAKLELKSLPSHLKYVFLEEGDNKPVIISSSLSNHEESNLIQVLKENKQAIGWALSDLKGISPSYCMHNIMMEDDYKPVAQPQRRLNPTMKEVVRKEVVKLLEAGMIYPISDSAWVSPVQVVPKKGGMTVIANDKNELIPSRTVTGWRMCIDYRRLNKATRKDHFPLPFMDQMLERLSGQEFYCFLDGYSGYNQISVNPEDHEKTAFTCPFGVFAYRRMPFGLCNAPATFQRCMQAIFSDLIEKCIEVFMDDFSVFGPSFDSCLKNLDTVLKRCVETNLVLNWEKCHFMVTEGIVLGHKISSKGIEVDKAKIEVIEKLPPPVNVKGIRSFLGHAGFYRRFIKDFSKIAKPLSNLLNKDKPFDFDNSCLIAFEELKKQLTAAPIIIAPDWTLNFELMCDASDYAVVGAVLGQRKNKIFHAIHYASKVLNDAQINYATTEKELLAIVYALEKFRSYLIGSKIVVYTDHAAIKYLITKSDSKPRLIRWMLLLQEFDIEIKDKKGTENLVADHLSRLVNNEVTKHEHEVIEEFPDEKLFMVQERPWFADMANYKVSGLIPDDFNWHQKKRFLREANHYVWDDPYLFKIGADNLLRRCVTKEEATSILWHCHNSPYGGHYNGERTAAKVLQSGFFWPTLFKDAYEHAQRCDNCQKTGGISKRNEMPLQSILEVEVFDCWGIDFVGPFPSSFSNEYILVAVDYVSKWVEAIASPKADGKTVIKFLKKNIFTRFGTPRVLISDGGSHFCNSQLAKALEHYGVKHKVASPYHPQTNGQAEVSNREIKKILEKTVSASRKDWSLKLDEALWAYRTAFKSPIGLTPFQMIYAGDKRKLQLHELEEMRFHAYESSKLYKQKIKSYHDKRIVNRDFQPGQKVLLFNSRFKLFPGKLKSKWSGPFLIKEVKPYGAVEIEDMEMSRSWTVNGQRLKPYFGGEIDRLATKICSPCFSPTLAQCRPARFHKPVMAPKKSTGSKKQKTGASSSAPAQVPAHAQNRFSGPEQYARFQELQARKIWPEKEFSIVVDGKHGGFVEAIEALGWTKLMDPERYVHPELVREFYANALLMDRSQPLPFMTTVRGRHIRFDRDAINDFLGKPYTRDGEDDICDYAATLARGNWDVPGMTELLLLPGRNLIYGKSGLPVRAKGEDLTPLARLALLFVLHNVIPRSHILDATMPILGLIYSFYKGYQVDIAKIISKELKDAVLSGTEKKTRPSMLPFPALIMRLIREARVVFSANFHDPLGTIDDPHVERWSYPKKPIQTEQPAPLNSMNNNQAPLNSLTSSSYTTSWIRMRRIIVAWPGDRPSFGDGVGTSAGANIDGDDDPIDEAAANAFVDDDGDGENTMED